jgi:hypothetical protein
MRHNQWQSWSWVHVHYTRGRLQNPSDLHKFRRGAQKCNDGGQLATINQPNTVGRRRRADDAEQKTKN